MAKARAIAFAETATVILLKEKLEELGLSSSGTKAALRARLLEEASNRPENELVLWFPENVLQPALDTAEGYTDDDQGQRGQADNDTDQELLRLREQLRKTKEIAELRSQLAALSSAESDRATPPSVFNFRDVEESLPQFSGDDHYCVKKWIHSLEESAHVFDWDDRTCLIYAKRLLVGTAKMYLRSNICGSWKDLKEALIREFSQKITGAEIHAKLRARRKERSESFLRYVLTMQEIASLTNIEEADLINYIIDGIPGPEEQKILLYGANTLSELKSILPKFERLYSTTNSHNLKMKSRQQFMENKPIQLSKVKCFNCNSFGH